MSSGHLPFLGACSCSLCGAVGAAGVVPPMGLMPGSTPIRILRLWVQISRKSAKKCRSCRSVALCSTYVLCTYYKFRIFWRENSNFFPRKLTQRTLKLPTNYIVSSNILDILDISDIFDNPKQLLIQYIQYIC